MSKHGVEMLDKEYFGDETLPVSRKLKDDELLRLEAIRNARRLKRKLAKISRKRNRK